MSNSEIPEPILSYGHCPPDGQAKARRTGKADKARVWFDAEGDCLEVQFRDAPGYMRGTAHDAVMKRVDEQGHVLGFSILGVSRFRKECPLEAELMAGT